MEFSLTKKKRKRNSEVHFMRLCLYVYNLQVAWFYQLLIDERPANLCLTFVSLHLCTTIIELKASAAPPSRSRSLPMVSACWVMCSWLCARHLFAVSPRSFCPSSCSVEGVPGDTGWRGVHQLTVHHTVTATDGITNVRRSRFTTLWDWRQSCVLCFVHWSGPWLRWSDCPSLHILLKQIRPNQGLLFVFLSKYWSEFPNPKLAATQTKQRHYVHAQCIQVVLSCEERACQPLHEA